MSEFWKKIRDFFFKKPVTEEISEKNQNREKVKPSAEIRGYVIRHYHPDYEQKLAETLSFPYPELTNYERPSQRKQDVELQAEELWEREYSRQDFTGSLSGESSNERNAKNPISEADKEPIYPESSGRSPSKPAQNTKHKKKKEEGQFYSLDSTTLPKDFSFDTGNVKRAIDERMRAADISFQQMLFQEIDRRGMTEVECYTRAHMDRKTFSKIRGNVHYQPKKQTAVALAMALRMSRTEVDDLIGKAGYALTNNNYFDVVIQYFIENRRYDLYEINEVLYYYDQPLLGSW